MSRKAYSEEERGLIRSRLMDVAAALFMEKGIRDTNIDEIYTPVGISKTFFYSFFPSKAVLAIAIMKEGMGRIGDLFRRNVWEYGAENGIKETFSDVSSGRFYIPGEDDQAYIREHLSEQELIGFQNDLVVLFSDMLYTVGVPASKLDPRVVCNMTLSVLMTRMTEGRRLLLTFAETADETSSLQIKSLVALVLENRVI